MTRNDTVEIAFNAFSAMSKIALMSCVGVFLAKYPRSKPIMNLEFIQTLSKLSNNVFVPCLIMTSLGSGVNLELLSRIGVLILFCAIINLISFFFAHTIGWWLHGRCKDDMYIALAVAVGSPNAISLPIMVLQTMCENDTINLDYGSSAKQCYTEGTSMLFVYSIGWHLMFWSYGFPILKSLKEKQLLAETTTQSTSSPSASSPTPLLPVSDPMLLREDNTNGNNSTNNSSSNNGSRICSSLTLCKPKVLQTLKWLQSVLLTPAMMAIIVGVTISLIPPLQRMLFEDISIFRPLGSAITTLGEPVVATSCLIMSASLANVDLSRGRPRIHHTESNEVEMTARDNDKSDKPTTKSYALLSGGIDESMHEETHSPVDLNNEKDEQKEGPIIDVVPVGNSFIPPLVDIVPLPSWRSVTALILCRLVLPPLLVIYALLPLALHFHILRMEDRLMQFIIAIESASSSAQVIIVSLNQLGLTKIASDMSYMYVFQFTSSIFTISFWATVAMSNIYIIPP